MTSGHRLTQTEMDEIEVEYNKRMETYVKEKWPEGRAASTVTTAMMHKALKDVFGIEQFTRYGLEKTEYVNDRTELTVICPYHGKQKGRVSVFRSGQVKTPCKVCNSHWKGAYRKVTEEQALTILKAKHPNLDFSEARYSQTSEPIKVICKVHGVFYKPYKDLSRIEIGCTECSGLGVKNALNKDKFLSRFAEMFGEKSLTRYDLSRLGEVKSMYSKITIGCPVHGDYVVNPSTLFHSSGKLPCRQCNRESASARQVLTKQLFLARLSDIHPDTTYDLSNTKYQGSKVKVPVNCLIHGEFWIRPNSLMSGTGCPKCGRVNNGVSGAEKSLFDFIKDLCSDAIPGHKLDTRKELDIFIPSKNVAIEFDGLYYHSEKFKKADYHKASTDYCQSIGIRLVHVFEDEWALNPELVKNRLRAILGFQTKIGARQCEVKDVSSADAKAFLQANHSQRSGPVPRERKGLYYKGALIALMTFGANRFKQPGDLPQYEVFRYCSTNLVVGGFSKLLKACTEGLPECDIYSYSDRRWSYGDVYSKNGFTHVHRTEPGMFWFKQLERSNREKFMKHKLQALWPEIYDPDKTADQMCREKGYMKIYDCGHDLWVKRYTP